MVVGLSELPRFPLVNIATPLEELSRLRQAVVEQNGSCPRLLIKRDDMTGLAFGGNKTRKLEFLIGDAIAKGADTIVTAGALQSNHARQTAAAAARAGLTCRLILFDTVAYANAPYRRSGNLFLDRLLGAEIDIHPATANGADVFEKTMEALTAEGRRPYLIPVGGSNALGALGMTLSYLELVEQAEEAGLTIDAVYHATASLGTQAGLVAGSVLVPNGPAIRGVNVYSANTERMASDVLALANSALARLGSEEASAERVAIIDGYMGEGYGLPTAEMMAAVSLAAQVEGVLLDPVYTGKAMAGLLGQIFRGEISEEETVVFLHTGGAPGLFAYRETFEA